MEKNPGALQHLKVNRRSFLKYSIAMTATGTFSNIIHANTDNSLERTLSIVNLHTHEELHTKYWVNGQYDTNSLNEINYILRDHRANEVHEINTDLIDLLHALHTATESSAPFHIISAYRSPQTNEKLRQQTSGVAKKSLHMQGMAIDVRLPDVELERLRDTAISLEGGGVGYYAKSNFLHLDIGKPRFW